MYPQTDILRISTILADTDMDRIQIVISLFEQIRILCHGYSTDMHYTFILFYFLKFYFMYIFYIRHRHKVQVIKLSNVELSTHQDKSVVTRES